MVQPHAIHAVEACPREHDEDRCSHGADDTVSLAWCSEELPTAEQQEPESAPRHSPGLERCVIPVWSKFSQRAENNLPQPKAASDIRFPTHLCRE